MNVRLVNRDIFFVVVEAFVGTMPLFWLVRVTTSSTEPKFSENN